MICKNCETEFNSRFCPACGQTADLHRITVKHVLHDFVHAFTHADKGIFLLTRQLFLRPGIVAREYVGGKRKKYFNPLSFFVLTMAIAAYFSYKSGYFQAMNRGRYQTVQASAKLEKSVAVKREMARINHEEGKLVGLVLIAPLMALLSWLLFIKSGYTYAENFVLASFLFGFSNVVRLLVFIPAHLALPGKIQIIDGIFQLFFLIYIIVGFRQFFQNRLFLTIAKSFAFLILFIALFWVFMYGYAYVKVSIGEMMG